MQVKNCSCGFPLLELVACRSCGKYMLSGEQYLNKENHKEFFQLSTTVTQDAFYIESEEETDPEAIERIISNKKDLFVSKYQPNNKYINNTDKYSFSKENEIIYNPNRW